LEQASFFRFRCDSVYVFAGVETETQVAQGCQRLLWFRAWDQLWLTFLQHHHETETIVFVPFAKPHNFHASARCVGVAIYDTQARVPLIKFDARLQTFHVQRKMRPLHSHSALLKIPDSVKQLRW